MRLSSGKIFSVTSQTLSNGVYKFLHYWNGWVHCKEVTIKTVKQRVHFFLAVNSKQPYHETDLLPSQDILLHTVNSVVVTSRDFLNDWLVCLSITSVGFLPDLPEKDAFWRMLKDRGNFANNSYNYMLGVILLEGSCTEFSCSSNIALPHS